MKNKIYTLLILVFCITNIYSQTAEEFYKNGFEKVNKKKYKNAIIDFTKSN